MKFPLDYAERVYAGVLGKIIGVYMGRPFEGWTYEQILDNLGEITGYVHDRHDLPLRTRQIVVTDDDISGTFTFLRALPDYGYSLSLTATQIGQTWLNYLIENRTVLWWGGLGNSTEHTAYLRLKNGIPAPQSGSIALNGKVVAEQIGAQIFIDGWGLIAPGDPVLAVDLARRAASVSHDGEAIYCAQVVAALVSQAFIEPNIDKLLDIAVALIPNDSVTYRLIATVRDWHAGEPDWHVTRAKLASHYGYDKYGGNCHIIPNHGLVILSLLYGAGDLGRSLSIVNTCGWDTDCNAGNVGCIMGVRNGLNAFEALPAWREPVADQIYLPTADGGRSISDAVQETYRILEIAHALRNQPFSRPKEGARFHFALPGSVQGFRPYGPVRLKNAVNPNQPGSRALALNYRLAPAVSAAAWTPTFVPPDAIEMPSYELLASPTVYPGQKVHAALVADRSNTGPVQCTLALRSYSERDELETVRGTEVHLAPSESVHMTWQIPDLGGAPVAQIGISISSSDPSEGVLYLDRLTWEGIPQVTFVRPATGGTMWKRQWVVAADGLDDRFDEAFRMIQNRGRGLAITGTREWGDYRVQTTLTPHLVKAFGLAARVQGLERYYALMLTEMGTARLIKRLDGEFVLAERNFVWALGQPYELTLEVEGDQVRAWVGRKLFFWVHDADHPLISGGVALVCEEGRVGTDLVLVGPCLESQIPAESREE